MRHSSVNEHQQDGEDIRMQSSPYMSSSMSHHEDQEDAIPSRSIVLAREEDLDAAKANFRQIYSIHIYSLGPSRVQNLQILSDNNRAISEKYANEDPFIFGEKYGVIHNVGVKRRTGRRLPVEAQPSRAETLSEKSSNKTQGGHREHKSAIESSDRPSPSDDSTRSTPQSVTVRDIQAKRPRDLEGKSANKPAPAKREQSDIFKSFSKPKANLKHENTASSTSASPAPNRGHSESQSVQEDEDMKDASEDEQDEELIASNTVNITTSKSRSERAEELRKMMEDEDEEVEDAVEDTPQISQQSEPVDASISQKESSTEPTVVNEGRRRGRRKVMKKKTIKDEEGYLVTKEEPAWESFSEEEPPSRKQKTAVSTPISSVGKGKKSGGKPGQGSIMSFFGKK